MKREKILLACALIVMVSVVVIQSLLIYQANGGKFIYPLDDAYIHLTIARNIATDGIWGVNAGEFAPASSSLIYPLLLAFCQKYITTSELAPLVINLLSDIAILFLIYIVAIRYSLSITKSAILYFGIIFFTPLPAVTISGMEHTLQIAIDLLYIFLCLSILSKPDKPAGRELVFFAIVSAMVSGIRYEGLFLIALFSVFLITRRQYRTALLGLCCGLLPIVVFGLYSVSMGGYFIPYSVLTKGQVPTISFNGIRQFLIIWSIRFCSAGMAYKFTSAQHLLMLTVFVICSLFIGNKRNISENSINIGATVFVYAVFIHTMFAKFGYFYRYEAYLVASGLMIGMIAIKDIRFKLRSVNGVLFILVCIGLSIPLFARGIQALDQTVQAGRNVYEQQFQMAQFVRTYYNNEVVALNDIGAVSFFTNSKIVDLCGLANKEVFEMKRANKFHKDEIDRCVHARRAKLAIIYDSWFMGMVPTGWSKVGEWRIDHNVICGSPTVSFYAFDKGDADVLSERLLAFSTGAKKAVMQVRIYQRDEHDDQSSYTITTPLVLDR